MPEINGIELIIKINEIKPTIKALLMSAFEVQDEEIFQQCMKEKYHKRIHAKANCIK